MKFVPAYSLFVLILILNLCYTLTGLPVSVFAQEAVAEDDATASTTNSAADQATATTTAGTDVADVIDADAVTDTVATPTAPTAGDTYKRERLMSDHVYSDFVVGPGRYQLEIAPGESKTVEMVITNRMGIPKTFTLTTEDMAGSSDPDESIVLLGERVGPYSIKDFISVPHRQFVLKHAERARIPVTVSIPADAEPGGFYGSLLTQIVSEDVEADSANGALPSSKVVSRIGTLFFVTTPGEITRASELKEFSTLEHQKFYTKGPVEFNIVTENTGSVHVTPFGELRIYNTLGTEVGYVELQPWYVLPKSLRNKEITWNREFMVGRYTAVAKINRGYDGIVDEVSYSFWVIPLELLAAVFGGFFVFFIILRFFFSRFEFKRKGS